MLKEMDNGSLYKGKLPTGCIMCERGSKMVLLVTGECFFECFYCPLSKEKQGKKVVYADELKAEVDSDLILEAKAIGAEGTGITGGDPMDDIQQTIHFIKLLKDTFGPSHHIHLYTATPDKDKIIQLAEAGLDEIRFHPPPSAWVKFSNTNYPSSIKTAKEHGLQTGLEIPTLPDMMVETTSLVRSAEECDVDFINLNELEFSESNWEELKARGYEIKDDISSAAKGSEEMACKIIRGHEGPMTIHYCSASFKDGIQLRRRILRRAENTATPLEIISDEGTFIKGIILCDDPEEQMKIIASTFEIPEDLIRFDVKKHRIEIAAWILEEIAEVIDGQCFIIEEYPTADRLEVERRPL